MNRRIIAVVLVLSLSLSALLFSATGCKPGKSVNSASEQFPAKRTVTIQPLYYKDGQDGPEGGFSKCKITVETNPSHELKVGFFEDEVGGAGEMWKASGWMASLMGTFLLGRDVSDYKFSFDTSGNIDGPSAGGLMTVAIISSLLGDDIKKDVTMTGTINPDGTIGPVGGIPQKLDGAKKAGKKTVLVPLGQRYDYDAKKEEDVDLVSLGEKKGITVKEVGNIYEAYKELTGKDLPKPDGATAGEINLPSDTFDKVKARATRWMSTYQEVRAKYVQGQGSVNPIIKDALGPLDGLMNQADATANKADSYLKQGMAASAYDQITTAVTLANMAYSGQQSVNAFTNGGMAGAKSYIQSVNPSGTKIEGMLEELKTKKPATMDDIMVIANAYSQLAYGIGLINQADSMISNIDPNDNSSLGKIMEATSFYGVAGSAVDMADDVIAFGMGTGKAKPAEKDKVKRLSEALRKAAEANIDYFDNVLLKDEAEKQGVSLGVIKEAFKEKDIDYMFALSADDTSRWLKEKLGDDSEASAYAVMGNSMGSFLISSKLIAKYYSLDVSKDNNGAVKVGHEKALIEMLNFGQKKAEEDINAARKAGAEPIQAMLDYETGKTNRDSGDVDDKLTALGNFWSATMQSEALLTLSHMKVKRAGDDSEGGGGSFTKVMGDQ